MYHALLPTKGIIETRQDNALFGVLYRSRDGWGVGDMGGGGQADCRLIKYKQSEDHHVGYM